MTFNRNSGSNRGGRFKPKFGNNGSREMFQAVCSKCGKDCQIPFRPTNGRPVFCSQCFEDQGNSSNFVRPENRNFNRSSNNEDRQMFNAICADCGDNCKVPFQPTSDKPVFCSNCFGDKKSLGGGKDKFKELNDKLDMILSLLLPTESNKEISTKDVEKSKKIAKKKIIVEESPILES